MTVNLSALSRIGERSESVAEMLPKLEEEMQQVEAICNEIAGKSSRPVCTDSQGSEEDAENNTTDAVSFNAPSSADAGRRLSVGAPLLLDRLTSEDDKAIQDFLELNYEMTETIQSIDSLLPSDRDRSKAGNRPEPAADSGTGDVPSCRSVSASNPPAGSRLPTRRDSAITSSKLPVPKRNPRLRKTASASSATSAGPTRTLSEGPSVNRRLSEVPVRQGQMKPQQKAKKFTATIGERVETPCGVGTVLFRGKTGFADGEWVGVELDEPGGKHDGEVAGRRYFSTAAGCGLFVRATSLQA